MFVTYLLKLYLYEGLKLWHIDMADLSYLNWFTAAAANQSLHFTPDDVMFFLI